MIIKTLGGYRALRVRIAFLIIALVVTTVPIGKVEPEHIKKEEPTTKATTEATTDPTKSEDYYIVLKAESYEKNIHVRFYKFDEKTLFEGIEFEVEVEDSKGNKNAYKDEDKDGILNIEGVVPGKATVKAKNVKGHAFKENPISVDVKDKIEIKIIENIAAEQKGPVEDTKRTPTQKTPAADTVKKKAGQSYGKYTVTDYVVVIAADIAVPTTTTTATTTEAETEAGATTTTTAAPAKTQLKDKSGNALYIKNGENYEAAYEEDYDASIEYFKKVESTHFYGWTLNKDDNKTYFYDADEKKVTGSQVIDGTTYTFDGSGILQQTLGIDVSSWQGQNIDWNAVKNSGVSFAILRVGFRGYGSAGRLVKDDAFEVNYQRARAAGVRVGVYFYSQATSNTEALEEASFVLEMLAGRTLDLPVFLDIENTGTGGQGRADHNSKATWNGVANTFCNAISSLGGYDAGVYVNLNYLNNYIDRSSFAGYHLWLAHWASAPGVSGSSMWQYSDCGSVAGISGRVDMNQGYI